MAELTMWGTRGTLPGGTKGRELYGSHTSCVSVEFDEGILIFDAGTGIVPLGKKLQQNGEHRPVHILFSHLHLDHVMGLCCFAPLLSGKMELHLYAAFQPGQTAREQIQTLFSPPYWPAAVGEKIGGAAWHEIRAGESFSPFFPVQADTLAGLHQGTGLMYRIKARGKTLVYGLDCEPGDRPPGRLKEFIRGCGLMIADGTYTDEEYEAKKGWGHGTWRQCVRLGEECSVERMRIAHHSPDRTDEELTCIQEEIDRLEAGRFKGRYRLAADGETMEL